MSNENDRTRLVDVVIYQRIVRDSKIILHMPCHAKLKINVYHC